MLIRYGRIYGVHLSENPKFLQDILRKEWGFDGIVMSDWWVCDGNPFFSNLRFLVYRFGTYSVDHAINAGLDLEMPGPPRWRTPLLVNHVLSAQKVHESTIDERVKDLLTFIQRQAQRNPDVVYGDGKERTRDSPEIRAFARRLAAEGIVLLKNENNVLPLKPSDGQREEDTKPVSLSRVSRFLVPLSPAPSGQPEQRRVAIIGPNAKQAIVSGGGSAALKPSYTVTPYEGLTANAPEGICFDYEVGCYGMPFTNSGLPSNLTRFVSTQVPSHSREFTNYPRR